MCPYNLTMYLFDCHVTLKSVPIKFNVMYVGGNSDQKFGINYMSTYSKYLYIMKINSR